MTDWAEEKAAELFEFAMSRVAITKCGAGLSLDVEEHIAAALREADKRAREECAAQLFALASMIEQQGGDARNLARQWYIAAYAIDREPGDEAGKDLAAYRAEKAAGLARLRAAINAPILAAIKEASAICKKGMEQ